MAQQKFNITNWKAYNNALITRGLLTFSVDETALHAWYCEAKPSLRGRTPHYSDMAMNIVMAITSVLMLKRIFGLTLCALQGFVDSIVTLIKVPLNCPDDTCISKRAKSGHVPFKTATPGEIAHLLVVTCRCEIMMGKLQRRWP